MVNIIRTFNKIIMVICLLSYVFPTICAAAIDDEKELIEAVHAKSFLPAGVILNKIMQENSIDAVKIIIDKVLASGDKVGSAVYFFQYGIRQNNYKIIKFLLHEKGLLIL